VLDKLKEAKAKGKARPSAKEVESVEQQDSEVKTNQADDVQVVEGTPQVPNTLANLPNRLRAQTRTGLLLIPQLISQYMPCDGRESSQSFLLFIA
jgi:hypothetical protein